MYSTANGKYQDLLSQLLKSRRVVDIDDWDWKIMNGLLDLYYDFHFNPRDLLTFLNSQVTASAAAPPRLVFSILPIDGYTKFQTYCETHGAPKAVLRTLTPNATAEDLEQAMNAAILFLANRRLPPAPSLY